MHDTVNDADRKNTSSVLFFVAENGTWYRAYPNGTVGAQAPKGHEIPNIADETVDIPPLSDRPVYVWKVTFGACETNFYNASGGETIATFPIPGCGGPVPPSETQSTEHGTETTASTAGFGLGVAILALVVMALQLIRR